LRYLSALLLILAFLNYLDYHTTVYAISEGIAEEGNPFSVKLMELGIFDEVKVGVSAALFAFSFAALELERRGVFIKRADLVFAWAIAVAISSVVALFYLFVVLNNLMVMTGYCSPSQSDDDK